MQTVIMVVYMVFFRDMELHDRFVFFEEFAFYPTHFRPVWTPVF